MTICALCICAVIFPAEPNKVSALRHRPGSASSLVIEWDKPQGTFDKFSASLLGPGKSVTVLRNGQDVYIAQFDDLTAGTQFSAEVVTHSEDQQSEATTGTFSTGQLLVS